MPPSEIGFQCVLCLSAVSLAKCRLLHCYHGFCERCVRMWLESNRIGPQRRLKQLYCPTCRRPARESDLGRIFVETVILEKAPEYQTRPLATRRETKGKEAEERQNPLTRRFTEDEWMALKELRTKLPHIFEAAFPRKENKLSPVTLWGIPINPLNPVADARVSVVLIKFLRARNLDVGKATKMMISTFKWRDEFNMDHLATEEFPQGDFGRAGHLFGMDKDGRPVTYNIYRGKKDITTVFADVPRYIRWRVQLMERGIRLIDFVNVDSMVHVFDYEGGGPGGDTNSMTAVSQAWEILGDYYPEFSFKRFFINVPTCMTWGFWLFKPLISTDTLAKTSVVGSGTSAIREALLPTIDARELPKRYGGDAEAF